MNRHCIVQRMKQIWTWHSPGAFCFTSGAFLIPVLISCIFVYITCTNLIHTKSCINFKYFIYLFTCFGRIVEEKLTYIFHILAVNAFQPYNISIHKWQLLMLGSGNFLLFPWHCLFLTTDNKNIPHIYHYPDILWVPKPSIYDRTLAISYSEFGHQNL